MEDRIAMALRNVQGVSRVYYNRPGRFGYCSCRALAPCFADLHLPLVTNISLPRPFSFLPFLSPDTLFSPLYRRLFSL